MEKLDCKAGTKHEGGFLCTSMMLMQGTMTATDTLSSTNKTQEYPLLILEDMPVVMSVNSLYMTA